MPSKKVVETITRSQGLPTKQVHSVCIANKFVWAATSNGLARYDGARLDVFAQEQGLLTHGLRSLLVFEQYLIICSDLGLDLMHIKSNSIVKSINTVELGAGWCQCAATIGDKLILLGCANGLWVYDLERDALDNVSLINPSQVTHLANIKGSGRIMGVTSHHECWLYDPLMQQVSHLFSSDEPIQQLDATDKTYWCVEKQRILELDADGDLIRKLDKPSEILQVKKLLPLGPDRLLIADQERLSEVLISTTPAQVVSEWASDVLINDMCLDDIGNLWIATDYSGLLKVPVLQQFITEIPGLSDSTCLCISHNSATNSTFLGGVDRAFTQNQQQLQEIVAFRNHCCWDIQQDKQGLIWAAAHDGLLTTDNLTATKPTCFKHQDGGFGRCLYFADDGVYFGTTGGLFFLARNSTALTPVLSQSGLTISYVYSIRELAGTVYVTTLGNGIWILEPGTANLQRHTIQDIGVNVYDIDRNQQGELIIAHGNRISKVTNGRVRHVYLSRDPVAAWTCRWYGRAQVLLGTSEGLKLVDANDGIRQFSIARFPSNLFWEFTTSRSLLLDQENCLCGTNDGAFRVALSELMQKVEAPIPEVLFIECSTSFIEQQTGLSLVQGSWQLNITLSCKWLWLDQSTSFEYRLRGFSKKWSVLDSRTLSLTSLPPGEYGLEVRVNNGLTQSNIDYPLLLIRVIPTSLLLKTLFHLTKAIKSAISFMMKIGDAWTIERRYKSLEQVVKHRTEELAHANKQLSLVNQKLVSLSETDQLTQLDNRHAFVNKFNQELTHAVREHYPISLLMIDIDSFKTYNDNYGHLEGDLCLSEVASCLRNQVKRATDLIARFGGEEFIIALPNMELEQAYLFAQQCVESVRARKLPHEYSPVTSVVTISIGVACMTPEHKLKQADFESFRQNLTEMADKNLYQAKQGGRNRACSA